VAAGLLDRQNGSSLDRLLLENDFKVQIQVADPNEFRIRVRMDVMGDTEVRTAFYIC
jgi:hypothetical protein